jgi:hypothetical protein
MNHSDWNLGVYLSKGDRTQSTRQICFVNFLITKPSECILRIVGTAHDNLVANIKHLFADVLNTD